MSWQTERKSAGLLYVALFAWAEALFIVLKLALGMVFFYIHIYA